MYDRLLENTIYIRFLSSRTDAALVRSSTPNTLSVHIPSSGNNGTVKTVVNASHSMPNVSENKANNNAKNRDKSIERLGSHSHGIDVSIEDVSETRSESNQSSRVSSYKSEPRGSKYIWLYIFISEDVIMFLLK